MSRLWFTMRHHGFDNSSSHFIPERFITLVSSTLTTSTLNTRSLKRFEAGFRQQTPVDLPPSLLKLSHKLCAYPYAVILCACGTPSKHPI